MPLSCANALRPTIALLYCTGNEVAADTILEARVSCVVSILFHHGNLSLRMLIAITTSSSAALPARSPMPLTVHSICRAPPAMPASELATAMPRSLWQCTENTALSEFGTHSMSVRMKWVYSSGTVYPTVSGMFTVVAQALITDSTMRQR